MKLIEKLINIIKNGNKPIRVYRSYISVNDAKLYRDMSKYIQPKGYNLTNSSLSECINSGIQTMKKDGFKIACDDLKNL